MISENALPFGQTTWIEICNGFVTRLRGALGLASSLERSPAPSLIGHLVHPDAVVAVVAFRGERPPNLE